MSELANRGTVKSIKNKYRPTGKFHYIYKNSPIINQNGELVGVTNPRDVTHIHSYGGEAIFFKSLSDGKLLGTRCNNPDCEHTGTTHIPFVINCPDCLEKMTVVDMTTKAQQTAKVHTFMVTERTGAFNTLDKPIKFINIEFDGVDTVLMGYLSCGDPKIGLQVLPIFKTINPTYTILDLSWVIQGTSESDLPDGFSF